MTHFKFVPSNNASTFEFSLSQIKASHLMPVILRVKSNLVNPCLFILIGCGESSELK